MASIYPSSVVSWPKEQVGGHCVDQEPDEKVEQVGMSSIWESVQLVYVLIDWAQVDRGDKMSARELGRGQCSVTVR